MADEETPLGGYFPTKPLTATEAKRKRDEATAKKAEKRVDEILNRVTESANDGRARVHTYVEGARDIQERVVERLCELGYKVDGGTTTIKEKLKGVDGGRLYFHLDWSEPKEVDEDLYPDTRETEAIEIAVPETPSLPVRLYGALRTPIPPRRVLAYTSAGLGLLITWLLYAV